MHQHINAFMHVLAGIPSRRDVLRGLAAAGIGLAALRAPDSVEARKRKKKAKLKRNEFGCVDVGGKCRGNDGNCCSGICEGKKPKKGKKDKSACVAHDNAGVCFADSDSCSIGKVTGCDLGNPNCLCLLTTGNAGFCGDGTDTDPSNGDAFCRDCARDTDCQAEFGPGAACVVLGGSCSIICPATGRKACIRPCPPAAP